MKSLWLDLPKSWSRYPFHILQLAHQEKMSPVSEDVPETELRDLTTLSVEMNYRFTNSVTEKEFSGLL